MAIPSWEHCLGQIRRDPLRVAAVGLAVGAGCLYAATRSTSYAVTVDPPRAQSEQAIRQVSHELDLETDIPKAASGARVDQRSRAASHVVPAVALVDAEGPGGVGLLQRVEPARFEASPPQRPAEKQPPVERQRPASPPPSLSSPARLTGTIEPIL